MRRGDDAEDGSARRCTGGTRRRIGWWWGPRRGRHVGGADLDAGGADELVSRPIETVHARRADGAPSADFVRTPMAPGRLADSVPTTSGASSAVPVETPAVDMDGDGAPGGRDRLRREMRVALER
jgi:hypothetical protein